MTEHAKEQMRAVGFALLPGVITGMLAMIGTYYSIQIHVEYLREDVKELRNNQQDIRENVTRLRVNQ